MERTAKHSMLQYTYKSVKQVFPCHTYLRYLPFMALVTVTLPVSAVSLVVQICSLLDGLDDVSQAIRHTCA